MFDYRQWILENLETVVFTLIGLLLLALIFFIINTVRLNQLHKQYRQLMKGVDKGNLEQLIFKQSEEMKDFRNVVAEINNTHLKLQNEIHHSIGPIGIVRYNAFDNTGSDLSFSVAFLNRSKNGVVISSLYGREDSRIYAKPIEHGESSYTMTDEEKEAVKLAVEKLGK